jgi:Mg-chelatase subunit ChlD
MKNKTEIIMLIDRSGSMQSIKEETISGFNEFLAMHKKESPDAGISLIQFDHEYTPVYTDRKIQEAEPLDNSTFVPRGMTALLDAIGKTVKDTSKRHKKLPKEERPERVIFVIITDGMENMSHKYNREQVMKMISKKQDKHNWNVIYLGANQDAIQEAVSMGINAKRSLTFAADKKGTEHAFIAVREMVSNLIEGNENARFSDEDWEAQKR